MVGDPQGLETGAFGGLGLTHQLRGTVFLTRQEISEGRHEFVPCPEKICYAALAWGRCQPMATLLWIIAVILVISGIYVILARRDLLWGIVLIVLGFLVGPGGVSIFNV
ncbi:hypothetical protein GCM10009850_100240 [Nonomuraea monospora]